VAHSAWADAFLFKPFVIIRVPHSLLWVSLAMLPIFLSFLMIRGRQTSSSAPETFYAVTETHFCRENNPAYFSFFSIQFSLYFHVSIIMD
jgi:hypothetical protein